VGGGVVGFLVDFFFCYFGLYRGVGGGVWCCVLLCCGCGVWGRVGGGPGGELVGYRTWGA